MKDQRSWMSDIERELSDDVDGKVLQGRKSAFMEYSNNLSRAMERGMGMEELQRSMEMKKAAEMASGVLETVWRKLRNGNP